jgi:hypothetical protein
MNSTNIACFDMQCRELFETRINLPGACTSLFVEDDGILTVCMTIARGDHCVVHRYATR